MIIFKLKYNLSKKYYNISFKVILQVQSFKSRIQINYAVLLVGQGEKNLFYFTLATVFFLRGFKCKYYMILNYKSKNTLNEC